MKFYLETNFTEEELYCKCGCGKKPQDFAVIALQNLRREFNLPMVVASGARCPAHNKEVGGKPKSKHLEGIAFDVHGIIAGKLPEFLRLAIEQGFYGFVLYDSFIHIDMRKDPIFIKGTG